MNQSSLQHDSVDVLLTPPPQLRPWDTYAVTYCTTNGTIVCHVTDCPASADPAGTTTCTLQSLTASTSYNVTAVAKQEVGGDTITSAVSDLGTFTTPIRPPVLEIVSAQAFGPTTGQATASSPVGTSYDSVCPSTAPQGC